MERIARLLCFTGLMFAWSGPGFVAAEPTASPQQLARQLFDDGAALARKGDHHKAADAFAQAWDLDRKPEYMRERAIALRNAGQSIGAIDSFKKYLAAAANAPDRAEIQALLADEQRKHDPSLPRLDSAEPRIDPRIVAAIPDKEGAAPSREKDGRPFYKSWWFWTAAGAVAAVSVGAGVGVWAWQNRPESDPYLRVSWR